MIMIIIVLQYTKIDNYKKYLCIYVVFICTYVTHTVFVCTFIHRSSVFCANNIFWLLVKGKKVVFCVHVFVAIFKF